MEEAVKKDILSVLNNVIDIMREKEDKDIIELKDLSNYTIHNASIFQDEDSISIAVLVYSIYKIIGRIGFDENNYRRLFGEIANAKKYLEKDKITNYRKTIKDLFKFISDIDKKLKSYIEKIINQAEIKKGSKLYEHGISIARAAELMGINQWELMSYIGKTTVADGIKTNVRKKIKYIRSLFEK